MGSELTLLTLAAITEALSARLAGELDFEAGDGTPRHDDYEAALDWSLREEAKLRTRRGQRAVDSRDK